jgi:hypothetical protein
MITPVHANPALYFRPLRDGPALCLTRNLSPDREMANCLLLDCKDIGDIILTILNNSQCTPSYFGPPERCLLDPLPFKHLQFTCCTQEPAIIGMAYLWFSLICSAEHTISDIITR